MFARSPLFILMSLWFITAALAQKPAPAPSPTPSPAPAPAPVKKKPVVKAPAPKAIGTFEDWIAATHQEAGQLVCYAFTRAQNSEPAMNGRGPVIMTVTQRNSGRDAVAMEAGFVYAQNAAVAVQADQTKLEFYTAQRNAFARNGHAAVAAFRAAGQATAHSPGPHDLQLTDTFSLKGFTAAYEAINKACPPK